MKTFNTAVDARKYSVINPSETVESTEYYRDGQLDEHRFYVAGELHGECKLYYRNGQLLNHSFYVGGKFHGEYKSWYDDGKLMYHFFYVNGEEFNVDHLIDGSYKSRCIKHTLFNGNLCNEYI